MVHENFRFRPQYVEARKWIAGGKLGEIRQARLAVRSGGMLPVGGETPALLKLMQSCYVVAGVKL